ncbi:MAG: hypothetical protein PHS48_02670 [Bacteroidales bacterium]|jgi:hypothetical protein|nr:hypothetical protein [Bacteroidales bacterium]
MEKKNSNISGFIDGYKAGNLSIMSNSFSIKKNDVNLFIDNILNKLKRSNTDRNFTAEVSSLKSNFLYGLDSFESWETFGESLSTIIDSFNDVTPSTREKLLPDIKKIIYHYLDLSKKSDDPKLQDIAIKIGDKLKDEV